MEKLNIFFSCDDNYAPFLSVALTSLQENRDPRREYHIRILHTGLDPAHRARLQTLSGEGFQLSFVDISSQVTAIASRLHTRDYFSRSTYYRLFIPELFPELDKALYLDSDLVVLGDISQLYDTALGEDLVGAASDSFVNSVEALRDYVRSRLGISDPAQYFNAGVLLMNLREMRKFHFQEVFFRLLEAVTFQVAQDQDYLNAICQGRVTYLGAEWNTMPSAITVPAPKLIHYNVDSKPWRRDDVPFAQDFWAYADRSPFAREIRDLQQACRQEDAEKSLQETVALIHMASRQAGKRFENARIHYRIRKAVGA